MVKDLLKDLDRESLKQKYRDIENLYVEACTKCGVDPYPTPEPGAESGTPGEDEAQDVKPDEGEPQSVSPSEGEAGVEGSPTPTPNPFLVTEDE